jgi:hypothetical protein
MTLRRVQAPNRRQGKRTLTWGTRCVRASAPSLTNNGRGVLREEDEALTLVSESLAHGDGGTPPRSITCFFFLLYHQFDLLRGQAKQRGASTRVVVLRLFRPAL